MVTSPRGSALGRVTPDRQIRLVRGVRDAFGLHGRSAEQRIALDLLLDESVTTEYKLGDINVAFDDMLAGHNIRGVILHDH